MKNVCISEITALLRHGIALFVEDKLLEFWRVKGRAVKKWRLRAWSIDPNKTNLTIIVNKEKFSQHVPSLAYEKWFLSQVT